MRPDGIVSPAMGVDVEQMPSPTIVIREGGLLVVVWGTIDPDPGERIERRQRAALHEIAASIHGGASGVYFLLLCDETSGECAFFVDQFACKKVFYYNADGVVHFSTNLYRLVGAGVVNPALDMATVATFLMYDYIPTNHTLLKGVRSLRSFTVYQWRNGALSESGTWPFESPCRPVGYGEAVSGTLERLEAALRSGSRGFDSLIVPLSGGQDSRTLLALALKQRRHRISTLTFGQPGTLDFDIGVALAAKLGVDARAYAIGDDFYRNHVVPSTPYANGLANHFLSPVNFLSGEFRSSEGQAVLSGYIGDLVLGWKKGGIPVLRRDGVRYPAPKQLSYDAALEIVPGAKDTLLGRLSELQSSLDDCCRHESIPANDWYYRIRVTSFTAAGLFGEKDEGFRFLTPFVNLDFLRWMLSVKDEVKANPLFYRDVVAVDSEVASLFRFPLKNISGRSYFRGRLANAASTAYYGWRAWRCGVRPKQNYANYERMYPATFVMDEALGSSTLQDLLGFDGESAAVKRLDYSQKTLLLSLKLHLDCLLR